MLIVTALGAQQDLEAAYEALAPLARKHQLVAVHDFSVVCGRDIPAVAAAESDLRGVEGVVDEAHFAELLAEQLCADLLLLLTDVHGAVRDWGTPGARPIATTTPSRLRRLDFAAGSMGPKVEAACRFVERTGSEAVIGTLEDAAALPEHGGTRVVPPKESRRRARGPGRSRRRSRR